jgi:hypothetical protein
MGMCVRLCVCKWVCACECVCACACASGCVNVCVCALSACTGVLAACAAAGPGGFSAALAVACAQIAHRRRRRLGLALIGRAACADSACRSTLGLPVGPVPRPTPSATPSAVQPAIRAVLPPPQPAHTITAHTSHRRGSCSARGSLRTSLRMQMAWPFSPMACMQSSAIARDTDQRRHGAVRGCARYSGCSEYSQIL